MRTLSILFLTTIFALSLSAQKGAIKYEKRTDLLNYTDCRSSEPYLKKRIKSLLAAYYTDYPEISVDFSSFKGQNGYTDKLNPKKFIYPYKIEMLVYLRRKITKEGKEKTELVTWKYDAVYEYASLPGRKCEFKMVPSSQITRTNHQEL